MGDCQQLSATSCMRSCACLCRHRDVTDQLPSVAEFLVAVSFVSTQGRHTPALSLGFTLLQHLRSYRHGADDSFFSVVSPWNGTQPRQNMRPPPISLYRHGDNLPLFFPLFMLIKCQTKHHNYLLLRYKTAVLSARGKVFIRLCTQKRTWRILIGCYSYINIGG